MQRSSQRGTSLTEMMVGTLIALIAAIAIFRTLAAAEAVQRNATGVADAQQTGLVALFATGSAIANSGNGIAAAARELATCPDTGDIRTSQRPLPLLIAPGSGGNSPDTIYVSYGAASANAVSATFAAEAPAGSSYRVQSPLGLAANDMIVAVSLTGHCALTTITAVSAPSADGIVEIAHTGAADDYPATSRLVNLGPHGRAMRVRYDLSDGALRSLDLLSPGASPDPIASNIVNLKAQYGVDTDDDGVLDAWVAADAAPWTSATLLAASSAVIGRIKAVRLGIVVKSEMFDRDVVRPFDWVLFDCPSADKAQCPGRLTGTLPAGWRYRIYETVVPLRNAIWNAAP